MEEEKRKKAEEAGGDISANSDVSYFDDEE